MRPHLHSSLVLLLLLFLVVIVLSRRTSSVHVHVDATDSFDPSEFVDQTDGGRQLLGLRGGGGWEQREQRLTTTTNAPPATTKDSSMIPISNITVPLHAHSGTHHVHLYVGSPPQRQILIVDTGSRALSFPCQSLSSVGCKAKGSCRGGGLLGTHASPTFAPSRSTTYFVSKCGSCRLTGISTCSLFGNYCDFTQSYTEGSSWTATEVEDMVWLGSSNVVESLEQFMPELAVAYSFGCQTSNKGLFRKQYADGILGLSVHETSLIVALWEGGVISRNAFSLCLTQEGGYLSLGGAFNNARHEVHHHHDQNLGMRMTPVTREHGYYSVEVIRLVVGNEAVVSTETYPDLLQDMNAGKGCILDSGTTDTFLPSSLREVVGNAVSDYTNNLVDFSSDTRRRAFSFDEFQRLPILTVILSNEATLTIRPDNYMEDVPFDVKTGRAKKWEGSLSLTNRLYLEEEKGAVLGINSMIGHDIYFDVQGHQVGIAASNCHVMGQVQRSID